MVMKMLFLNSWFGFKTSMTQLKYNYNLSTTIVKSVHFDSLGIKNGSLF